MGGGVKCAPQRHKSQVIVFYRSTDFFSASKQIFSQICGGDGGGNSGVGQSPGDPHSGG